ncbi:hypothetical protein GW626_21655 [Peribacillus muralis]|nr:hypothetical protein [Peribacillus muralis]MCK1994489.1 hypothetical protein [Peribacillus muralis]MCK2015277.1 hypothetical protein [Peribacillus muralis]
MKTNSNKQPLNYLKQTHSSKPTERKQMSDFIKKMKLHGQNAHLNEKNS